MSKKKRTYHSDAAAPATLKLQKKGLALENSGGQENPSVPKKELFTEELIARLTERIKKI